MPDTYTVRRETRIDAPASVVYAQLIDFRRWGAWSPFESLDPGMDRTYSGAESGVGSVYEWSGNMKAGTGRLEMVEAVPNERLILDQRNHKPIKSETRVEFLLNEQAGATTVAWSMTGKQTRMTRVMGIFKSMDGMIGPVFEQGLAKLKDVSEAAA